MTLRIAMWSGPRNISTAMMRAFENRPDTEVWDEPFYAHYLLRTGIPHPGAKEVIAHYETDWKEIAKRCLGKPPGDSPVFYQKHMTMHLLSDMGRDWMPELVNCFLIRSPEQVVASYGRVRPDVTLDDVGFVQQAELYRHISEHSENPPLVIDSRDFLINPEPMLECICDRLGIPYREEMMSWPPGKRESDGLWGKHWYDSVWESTTFQPYREVSPDLSPALRRIVSEAEPYYQALYPHRLTV